ncbi:glycine--tRNA ligase subunit beta [Alphaproteobacteria bacterium]|nr:glycine--tRNA ligase subunit beta [Alphaproteobacteria bacterium]
MSEFLLEILSEEIPARMQKRAAEDLKRFVTDGLKKANLEFSAVEAYATPRRLALVINGLPDKQPDVLDERKGPRVDAPEKAIAGFLRGAGLESLDQCEKRDTGKGEAWFAVIERAGLPTRGVFPDLLNDVFTKFPWPKSMRWGTETQSWVRPIQGILCVLDGDVVENVAFNGQVVNNMTVGHRFLSPAPITVSSFADYKQKLRNAHVILDSAERRSLIESGLKEQATAEGLIVKDDPALLDEVAGLVEWPVPLLGDIDTDFMELPGEALTSSMRTHQKYFSLLNPDGTLVPRFGFVANINATDGGAAIVAGNERVLRARLADAKFFWDQDRRTRLEDLAPALDAIVFHAKLGTVTEKVQRITALATDLVDNIPGADRESVRSAATLCKADLVTGMVAEFPDLQGIMGQYYALGEGEAPDVAQAIAEHYSPVGPNDACPTAPTSVAVALADKIDTLVGFWLIDEKPTGSKDPFALRRAALGVIRLVLENNLRLNLRSVFASAMRLYPENTGAAASDSASDLMSFFADRLKVYLRERGVRYDLIVAVFAIGGEDDLVRLLARVDALTGFLNSEDGGNLLTAFRRGSNIVRIEEKKDSVRFPHDAYDSSLAEGDEDTLRLALSDVSTKVETQSTDEDYAGAMASLSGLRRPVDAFFDTVTVNDDDPVVRKNRLCLLANIVWVMNSVADFSQIEG